MKIDVKSQEFLDFKSSLPEEIQNESFVFVSTFFGIAESLFVIKKLNLSTQDYSVAKLAKYATLDYPKNQDPKSINILNGVSDEVALKENINVDIPIIVALVPFRRGKKKEIHPLVIDGNKRLRKAFVQDRKTIGTIEIAIGCSGTIVVTCFAPSWFYTIDSTISEEEVSNVFEFIKKEMDWEEARLKDAFKYKIKTMKNWRKDINRLI